MGTVRAFSVIGDVTLRNDTSGAEVPLTPGREFTEGFTVITRGGSSVTLVQSNGASINLEENTSLSVNEFLQDPYNTSQGTYTKLQEDPSTSSTRIKLNYGEITGNVKRLRSTSSYNVDLPTGSAGIRGTSYRARVTFSLDPTTGNTIMNIAFANADGEIVFNYNDVITDIPPQNEITIEGSFEEEFDPENEELPEGTFEFSDPEEMENDEVEDIITEALRKLGQSEEEQDQQDGPPGNEDEDEGQQEEEDDDDDDVEIDDNPDGNPEGDEDDFFDELSPSNNES